MIDALHMALRTLPQRAPFSPLGLGTKWWAGASDATWGNATSLTDHFYRLRDLTITAGEVATLTRSPTIIVCRRLTFGSSGSVISANGVGGAGGTTANSRGGRGALNGQAAAQGTYTDPLGSALHLVLGAGGAENAAGAASTLVGLHEALELIAMGCVGGGGGGGGGTGAGADGGTSRAGVRGQSGQTTSGRRGGGGGSGVGGGGGGGGASDSFVGAEGNGGAGGGTVLIVCDTIAGAAGTVRANGADGTAAGGQGGHGGDGGGGLVIVLTRNALFTPVVQANAGAGPGQDGGAGFALVQAA